MTAAPATLAEVRKRLAGVLKEIQKEFGGDETESSAVDVETDRWAITMIFAPVWPKGHRRVRS